ncbi:MAG: hypothetical protein JW915_18280 [Chitinispirillaceae bacterium]|nr:hypothetical protein [Chitinispirillaceae bacterium]
MKVNICFLLVCILCILFSHTTAWNGQTTLMHLIDETTLDGLSYCGFNKNAFLW